MKWHNKSELQPKSFICGYCNHRVSSDKGFLGERGDRRFGFNSYLYICPHCDNPTYFHDGGQLPGVPLGKEVKNLPESIQKLYQEIRQCTSYNSFTLAILGARKLLMHIAVDKGAEENLKFVEYVDYLERSHSLPPNSKGWVDKIRTLGNDTNHEIILRTKEDSENILKFIEVLLIFMYEYGELTEVA